MQAISAFFAGKPVSVGLFPSQLANGRQVVILAKLKANKKTGRMIQLAFLDPTVDQRRIDPDQPNGQGCDRRCSAFDGCYVQSFVFHIGSIAGALAEYQAGTMPAIEFGQFLNVVESAATPTRIGEFGDPASVEFDVIDRIVLASRQAGWTGYSHHWRNCDQRLAQYVMASVETETDYQLARSMGWRCFQVGGQVVKGQRLECLNTSQGLACAACRLCRGNEMKFDIVIEAHGRNAKRIGQAG
jgi:hypothetical protein